MTRRAHIWVAALLGIVATLIIAALLFFRWDNRRLAAGILNISKIPWSVSWVHCGSIFTTDVLTTCAFSVDPTDFPLLLSGYNIQVTNGTPYRRVHDYPMALELGENFPVAASARVKLPIEEAPNGGFIELFTNEARDHVLVHLYIE